MSEIKTYQHKDLLNRLSEMQRSPYYATACHDLVKAEMAIVSLEQERDELRAKLAELEADKARLNQIEKRYLASRLVKDIGARHHWAAFKSGARAIEQAIKGVK